ncbi:MAG: NAD(P)/FAD-dependent oxidoreductase, partial [Pseudobdellovibrionaceae bacterium]
MPPRIFQDIAVPLDQDLKEKIELLSPGFTDYRVLRQSVDARRSHSPHFVYSLEVSGPGEKLSQKRFELKKVPFKGAKPLIIGSGPAGLFAALRLVERGIPCHLFERGSEAGERMKGINRYWRYGELDPRNNVCFGEGGAGLYSDGKLITRIKSPHIPYVLRRLVEFGAPAEIEYLSNPHVGSDKIRRVIPKIREFLKQNGCEIHFNTQVTEFLMKGSEVVGLRTEKKEEFHSNQIIMATGHSAEDILMHLVDLGVKIEGKSFAMGLRIEHPQSFVNQTQYRKAADHPKLGAANYRLADHDHDTGIGVYSFCMCPGGFVLSSGTEKEGVVSNGMSNYHRNSPFANAAIVVTVDHEQNFGKDILGGLKLRRKLETDAFMAVQKVGKTKELPAQKLTDFLSGRLSSAVDPGSCPSGAASVRLDQILTPQLTKNLKKGLEKFDRSMKGFVHEKAQLFGIESRTSCPLRIPRDPETLQSVSHSGLYPCGEGAGYAGGITSAACDGIKIADKIASSYISTS